MKTLVAIYTGKGLAAPLGEKIAKTLPNYRLISILDENIIGECIENDGMPKQVEARLISYYKAAEQIGASLILNTCSSVGQAVYEGRKVINTPILRIDEPFVEQAVKQYDRIGIIATLNTTLNPTIALVDSTAKQMDKTVTVVNGLAKGAYEALISGNPDEHDRLIEDKVRELQSKVDCILLAQGSMARMEEALNQISTVPVLASPQIALNFIKEHF